MAVHDDDYRKRSSPVRWREVAGENGRAVHRLMKWYSIDPARNGPSRFVPPEEGQITTEMVEILFDIFVRHSGEDQECICAVWDGFGNVDHLQDITTRVEGIGQQGHYLLSASLTAVRDQWLLVQRHAQFPYGLTPNAVWPVTKDWYYAVPFEMRSSYFGGSAVMADEIRDAPGLETYEVFPGDDICPAERGL